MQEENYGWAIESTSVPGTIHKIIHPITNLLDLMDIILPSLERDIPGNMLH
ncbi:MAG: hypothetical protein GX020_03185 [Firmicutes bacterium]|nr:hypothetical protein [Bacillota bacterium]